MLRLRPPTSVVPQTVRWPAFKLGDPSTAFSSRPPLRELTVVIDDEIYESAHDGLMTKLTVLLGLLSHEYVTLLRYRDDGPGAHVPADTTPGPAHGRSRPAPGWLVVAPAGPDGYHQQVAARFGDSVHHAAIFGNGPDAAEHDDDGSYDELGRDEARARRRADAIAVQAASAIGADVYVTRRPYLHAVTWDLACGVLVATPDDVLPLISLYLRTQGEFITYRSFDGTASSKTTKGMFYWIGVREFLPAGWRWFAACVQHREHDEQIIYLAQSAFRRVQRALEARDDALRALNQPQHNDTATDALANLDLALLALMGAVDVTARVAHQTLRLTGTERVAGWQNKTWLRQVKKSDPDLANAFAPGSRHRRALSILGALRNSIHGAALSPLAVSDRGRRYETLARILQQGERPDRGRGAETSD